MDISNLKINHLLENTNSAFYNCYKLTSLNLSSFNLSFIKDASHMFYNCTDLKYVKLPNNIFSIYETNYMFENCYELTSLNLGFLENAKKWSSARGMLKNCKALKNIEIPSVTPNLLTKVDEMFSGCTDLEIINFEKLEAINILNIARMFYHCEKLEYLELSKFNTLKVRNLTGVFEGVNKKVEIIYNENITDKEFLKEIENITNRTIL